jgi:hypothetical protein
MKLIEDNIVFSFISTALRATSFKTVNSLYVSKFASQEDDNSFNNLMAVDFIFEGENEELISINCGADGESLRLSLKPSSSYSMGEYGEVYLSPAKQYCAVEEVQVISYDKKVVCFVLRLSDQFVVSIVNSGDELYLEHRTPLIEEIMSEQFNSEGMLRIVSCKIIDNSEGEIVTEEVI